MATTDARGASEILACATVTSRPTMRQTITSAATPDARRIPENGRQDFLVVILSDVIITTNLWRIHASSWQRL